MKKYLISALLIAMAAVAFAQTQQTFTAPMKPTRVPKSAVKKPPPLQKEQTRGVLARAFAHGNNPVQMLNPKAPPERYGTSQEHVAYDPYTGKPVGIKLLEIVF